MQDIFSIAGKVAIVTGGSRGIGEMIAAGFLGAGAKGSTSVRGRPMVCDATAKRLADEYGGECVSVPADLSQLDGIEKLFEAVQANERQLDILVNNAGATWGAPLGEFPEIGWDKVMDTNVKGIFFLTQSLLPLLEAGATARGPGAGHQHRLGGRHQDARVSTTSPTAPRRRPSTT